MSESSALFQSLKVGDALLSHRVVMAPLTRVRAQEVIQTPTLPLMKEYYSQRASEGGLLITEATFIHKKAGGYSRAPGIYTQDHIEAWKDIVEGVHDKGGKIFMQLWAIGRANTKSGAAYGHQDDIETVSSSDIALPGSADKPRPLTIEEIKEYVGWYKQAAFNAIEAGFDGVEVHGANGYLPDQFQQSVSNKRTDDYGGSVENRCRFTVEIVDAVIDAIGAARTGIRFSPWSTFQEMQDPNPFTTFGYLVEQMAKRKIAYVHMLEPFAWAPGSFSTDKLDADVKPQNDYFRAILRGLDPSSVGSETRFALPSEEHPTVFLANSGFDPKTGPIHAERTNDAIVYGRWFISNPDLPRRIEEGLPLNQFNYDTFYRPWTAEGYVDYPFFDQVSQP